MNYMHFHIMGLIVVWNVHASKGTCDVAGSHLYEATGTCLLIQAVKTQNNAENTSVVCKETAPLGEQTRPVIIKTKDMLDFIFDTLFQSKEKLQEHWVGFYKRDGYYVDAQGDRATFLYELGDSVFATVTDNGAQCFRLQYGSFFEDNCNKTFPPICEIFKDVKNCTDKNGGCQHICKMTTCECNLGFQLSKDGKTCTDINECLEKNGGCQHTCNNSNGSYTCDCEPGFRLSKGGGNCIDIDECETDNGGCYHTCQNTNGGYNCSCHAGFYLSKDGKKCPDVDECSEGGNGGCMHLCENNMGGRNCLCHDGYKVLNVTNCIKKQTTGTNTNIGLIAFAAFSPLVLILLSWLCCCKKGSDKQSESGSGSSTSSSSSDSILTSSTMASAAVQYRNSPYLIRGDSRHDWNDGDSSTIVTDLSSI